MVTSRGVARSIYRAAKRSARASEQRKRQEAALRVKNAKIDAENAEIDRLNAGLAYWRHCLEEAARQLDGITVLDTYGPIGVTEGGLMVACGIASSGKAEVRGADWDQIKSITAGKSDVYSHMTVVRTDGQRLSGRIEHHPKAASRFRLWKDDLLDLVARSKVEGA